MEKAKNFNCKPDLLKASVKVLEPSNRKEPSSFQTFSAIREAMYLSTFSFVSLLTTISLNSSKVYSEISKTKNLDKKGSIIFLHELAVAKSYEASFICLVLLILVSDIILSLSSFRYYPVSIKSNKDVWSVLFIFSSSSGNE